MNNRLNILEHSLCACNKNHAQQARPCVRTFANSESAFRYRFRAAVCAGSVPPGTRDLSGERASVCKGARAGGKKAFAKRKTLRRLTNPNTLASRAYHPKHKILKPFANYNAYVSTDEHCLIRFGMSRSSTKRMEEMSLAIMTNNFNFMLWVNCVGYGSDPRLEAPARSVGRALRPGTRAGDRLQGHIQHARKKELNDDK